MKLKYVFILLVTTLGIRGLYGQQLYTDANAASIVNEANATAGWESGLGTVNSVATNPQNGNFALEFVSGAGTAGGDSSGAFMFYSFPATAGQVYSIRIWARRGAELEGYAPAFAAWQGVNGFATTTIDNAEWTAYDFTVTATNANPLIRVYTGGAASNLIAGNSVFIDGISISVQGTDAEPPAAPTNLAAANTNLTSTQLSWTVPTDNVGVVSYEIFRNGVSVGTSNTAAFTATGLVANTNYSFTVVALDAAGNTSAPSAALQVTTGDNLAPSAIANLSASNTTSTTTTLSWTAATDNIGVVGYRIYSNGVQIGTTTLTNFTVNDLVSATTYAFTVRAIDDSENLAPVSNTVNVTTLDNIRPDAVTDLAASLTTATTTVLSWSAANDNVGVTNYEIFRNGVRLADAGPATTFTVTGLTSATTYTFTVFAQDAAENSSVVSNTVTVTTLDIVPPAAVADLTATSLTQTTAQLSWTAATDNVGVVNYQIFSNGVFLTDAGLVTSFIVTGLAVGNSYEFTVVTEDAAGNESNESNTATLSLQDSQAPTAITTLAVSGLTGNSVTLTWGASTDNIGVVNYRIYQNNLYIGDSGTNTTYTVTGLSNSTTYAFTVRAEDLAENLSANSNPVFGTTLDTTGPSAISDLSASTINATDLTLSWTASTDNVGVGNYRVFQDGNFIGNAGRNTTYRVFGLTTATTYVFNVVAEDASGNTSDPSNNYEVRTLDNIPPSAISDLAASNVTDVSVRLSWSASSDNLAVTDYLIFQNGVNIGNSEGATAFTVQGLTTATTYTFTVFAQDEDENTSAVSNSLSVTTLDSEAPSAILNLSASNITASTINLSWGAASDNVGVTNYSIFNFGIPLVDVGTSTSYSLTGLPDGVAYRFTVIAEDAAGNSSPLGNVVNVSTLDVSAPSAITDLAAANVTDTSLQLTWTAATDNVEVVNYEIYQGESLIGNVSTASFSVTGLTNGTNYSYSVIAQDGAGNESESNTVNVSTVDTENPGAVTDLASSNLTATSVTLRWSEATDNVGVTNYQIFQNGEFLTDAGAVSSYEVTGLSNTTSYFFYVVAQDAQGNESDQSNLIIITTPDGIAPTPVVGLVSSNTTATATTLTWNASSDNVGVFGYEIFRDGLFIGSAGTNLTFRVNGLASASTYLFYVLAVDGAGNYSEIGDSIEVSTPDITAPFAVNDLVAQEVGDQSVLLSWSPAIDNVGISNYAIYLDEILVGNSGEETSFTVEGLATATSYSFYVIAQDAGGNQSLRSNIINVTTLDSALPSAISDLAASNVTFTSLDLSWSPSTDNVGIVNYEVFMDGESLASVGTNTSYSVTDLINATTYEFTVVAQDLAGNSSLSSNLVSVTTLDSDAPTAVTDLTASNTTNSATTLSWSAASDNTAVANYEIFRDSVSLITIGNATTYTVTGLADGVTYGFTIAALDAAGNSSDLSNEVSITTLDSTAPSVVTGLLATNTTATSTELSWNASTDNVGVVNYEVFRNGVSIGNTGTETSFSVTGLTSSTSYAFTVRVRDAANNVAAASSPLFVTTLDITPPTAVADLTASSITESSLVLNWSAASDNIAVVNYLVYQDGEFIANTGRNLSFTVTGLTPLTEYNFTVVAEDAAFNQSESSNVATVTTIEDNEVPSIVINFVAFNTSAVSTQLAWSAATDNIGVANYQIFSGDSLVAEVGTDLSYTVNGLTPGTEYTFTIIALDGSGNASLPSSGVTITTSTDILPPSDIVDLTAGDITATSALLTWTPSTDNDAIADYEVFQNGLSIGFSEGSASYTVTGLSPETAYSFTVIAIDASFNQSQESNIIEVTTLADNQAPEAIADLSASNITAVSVTLTWSVPSDNFTIAEYEIYQNNELIGNSGTSNSFEVTGLTPETAYTFTVLSKDPASNVSEVSNAAAISTLADTTNPSLVSGIVATNIAVTSATISWSAATDNHIVADYVVFVDGSPVGNSDNSLTYNLTGLFPGVNYLISVVSQDASGNTSDFGEVINFTTSLDVEVPAAITDLSASNITSVSLDLSWSAATDNVGVVSYDIFQDGERIGTSGTNTSYQVTGLTPETFYNFTVVAQDASSNNSAASNVATVQTDADSTAPSIVQNLIANNITVVSVELSWDPATDNNVVSNYEIFRNGSSIGNSGAVTSFVATGLIPNTTYSFAVRAQDAAGNASVQSVPVIVTTLEDTQAPAAITDLAASSVTSTTLVLNWTVPADNAAVSNYEIFQDGESIGETSNNSFTVTGLTPETEYSFTVIAEDASGNRSEESNILIEFTALYPDTDGDGVKDNLDLCPDTPAGTLVDVNGCEVFYLPADAFSVSVTSATCVGSATGKINVSASNTAFNYVVRITGRAPFNLTNTNIFNSEVTGLAPGNYEVCFSVQGNDTYTQCYNVNVGEPSSLSASSWVNLSGKSVSLNMSGSKEYIVSVNGKSRVTESSEITLDLEPGMNYIEVRTELECQGTYFEQIFVSEEVRVYPNPTMDWVQVYVSGTDSKVDMNLVDLNGNVLQRGSLDVPATREVALDLSQYPVGVYVIQLSGKTVNTSLKVIKH